MSISSTSTAHGNSDSILNLHEPDIPEITPNADWIADTETTLSDTCSLQTQSECTNDVTEMKEKMLENYCHLKIETVDSKNEHVHS